MVLPFNYSILSFQPSLSRSLIIIERQQLFCMGICDQLVDFCSAKQSRVMFSLSFRLAKLLTRLAIRLLL